jgi:hypothetical protein
MTQNFFYRYDDDDEYEGDSDEDNWGDTLTIQPSTPSTVSKGDADLREPDYPVPKRQRSIHF